MKKWAGREREGFFWYAFGLRRRGPNALSADNSFSGTRYYAGESSDFDVFYFSVFFTFLEEAIWTAQAWPKRTFQ